MAAFFRPDSPSAPPDPPPDTKVDFDTHLHDFLREMRRRAAAGAPQPQVPRQDAPPRTLDTIATERAGVFAEIGLKTWQRSVLERQVAGLYNQIEILNQEAAKIEALPKVPPDGR